MSSRSWILAACVVGACGSTGAPASPDATPPDAGLPRHHWSAPVAVAEVPADTECGTMTEDGLEIEVSLLNRTIWRSTRADAQAAWSPFAPVDEIAIPNQSEWCPRISADGLALRFSTAEPPPAVPQPTYVMMESVRGARDQPWGTPVPQANDSFGAGGLSGAAITGAGNAMVWDAYTDYQVPPSYRLFLSRRPSSSEPWAPWERLDEVYLPGIEQLPALTSDQRELTFTYVADPQHPSCGGAACSTLMAAVRPVYVGPFSAPEEVGELTGGTSAFAPSLSVDDHTIVFFGRTPDGHVSLYRATR